MRSIFLLSTAVILSIFGKSNDSELTLAARAYEYELKLEIESALQSYQELNETYPENPIYYFKTGKLLSWLGKWKEAESQLLKALEIRPEYYDAEMALGVLYLWELKLEDAEEIFYRYPESLYAQENLAQIDLIRGNYLCAEATFASILTKDAKNPEVRRGLARALMGRRKYKKAKPILTQFVHDFPKDSLGWQDLFRVKHHTNHWAETHGGYSWAKETQTPSTISVIDQYSDFSVAIYFPLANKLLLRARPFWNTQKEVVKNSVTHKQTTYFNALMTGGIGGMTFFLPSNWSVDLSAKIKASLGRNQTIFKFDERILFEPRAVIAYETDPLLFITDAGADSFIIKDFKKLTAELLQTQYIGARCKAFLKVPKRFFVNASVREYFYNQVNGIGNNQTIQSYQIGTLVPNLESLLSVYYQYDWSHFSHVLGAYPTWDRKVTNSVGIDLRKIWDYKTTLALSYIYSKIAEKGYSTEAGFIFKGSRYYHANTYFVDLSHRVKDRYLFGISGNCYDSTFPYIEFGVRGRIEWVF